MLYGCGTEWVHCIFSTSALSSERAYAFKKNPLVGPLKQTPWVHVDISSLACDDDCYAALVIEVALLIALRRSVRPSVLPVRACNWRTEGRRKLRFGWNILRGASNRKRSFYCERTSTKSNICVDVRCIGAGLRNFHDVVCQILQRPVDLSTELPV